MIEVVAKVLNGGRAKHGGRRLLRAIKRVKILSMNGGLAEWGASGCRLIEEPIWMLLRPSDEVGLNWLIGL